MKLRDKKDIKDYILNIENSFDVNLWKINEIHIWPVIRINLYFYLINKVEFENKPKLKKVSKNKSSKLSFRERLYIKIRENTLFKKIVSQIWFELLPRKEYLFVAHDSHRVDYKKSRFNRFFDVYIEKHNLQNNYFYLEYNDNPLRNQYKRKNIINLKYPLTVYLERKKCQELILNLKGYSSFLKYLEELPVTSKFSEIWSETQLKKWANVFLMKVDFFSVLLKKSIIKKIHVLCYYNQDVMALVVAANQSKIKTIELQHGPQSDIHMAYSNWSCLPPKGYEVLPVEFWCWDEESKSTLKSWMKKSNVYNINVVGNFWVDYWKEQSVSYAFKNYILYSLQTHPLTVEDFFPENLMECIKESEKLWFVRLHPRGMHLKDAIVRRLKFNNLLDKVNIKNATEDPLPLILSNADLHVTNYSGTTLEASMYKLKTIFLSQDGVYTFPELIKQKKAFFISVKSLTFKKDFINQLKK